MRFLFEGGITEYEDDSEYAPSGCISFMTIHQSKGMEFPVVMVDSLSAVPRTQSDGVIEEIEKKYFHRPTFETKGDIKFFLIFGDYITPHFPELRICWCFHVMKKKRTWKNAKQIFRKGLW